MHRHESGSTTLAHAENILHRPTVEAALDERTSNTHQLLCLSRNATLDLKNLHPSPAHIFQLWQIYLSNVNPLLRVTHVPTTQTNLTNAVNHLQVVDQAFEAFMFGMYCISLLSLSAMDCENTFGTSRHKLLELYQAGCREALSRCDFLHSKSRDCLTALHLYLVCHPGF